MSTPSSFKGTGGFDAANQKVTNLADALNPTDALNLRTFETKNTVATYSTTRTYSVDFIVEYAGQLWKCVSATSGAFDKTKWIAIRGTENWIRITGAYTAAAMDSLVVDTTSAAISITLPASPKSGDYVTILDAGNADINNITVIRNGSTIAGVASNLVLNEPSVQVTLVYLNGTWFINIERVERIKFVSSTTTVEPNMVYAMLISAAFNVTLPQSPKTGDWVVLLDRNGNAGTYPITINGGVKQIDGAATYLFNQKKASTQFIYNGTGWVSFMLSGNALLANNNLSDIESPSTARTSLGLGTAATQTMGTGGIQIRTNSQNDLVYQPLDQTLTALAAMVVAADKLVYATGVDTFAQTDFPAQARTLLAASTQALQRTALGLGTAAVANVGTAAGNVMEVGAFGLGGSTPIGDGDLNNYRAGGFYLTPLAGVSNLPTGWAQGRYTVMVCGSDAQYVSQILIYVSAAITDPGKIAFRWSTVPGNWSAWNELASGFGTAAYRNVGTSATNVMEVGAFGLGSTDLTGPITLDVNTLLTTGIYYAAAESTNIPLAESGFIFVSGADASATRATQTYRSVSTAKLYERRLNITWSAWIEILHSGNVGNAAYATIGTTNGNVMPVGAGGWLSGAVVAQTLDLNTLVTTQTLYVHSGSTNLPLVSYGQLFHLQYGDIQYAMQKFFTIANVEYVRYKIAGTWGAWTQTLTLAQQFPTWTNVTFQNGWVDNDTSQYNSAQYRKEGNRVWLRGDIKNPSAGNSVIFTLPVGFRPLKIKNLVCLVNGGLAAYIQVNTTGAVTMLGQTYTANWVIMIDSLSFEID